MMHSWQAHIHNVQASVFVKNKYYGIVLVYIIVLKALDKLQTYYGWVDFRFVRSGVRT